MLQRQQCDFRNLGDSHYSTNILFVENMCHLQCINQLSKVLYCKWDQGIQFQFFLPVFQAMLRQESNWEQNNKAGCMYSGPLCYFLRWCSLIFLFAEFMGIFSSLWSHALCRLEHISVSLVGMGICDQGPLAEGRDMGYGLIKSYVKSKNSKP